MGSIIVVGVLTWAFLHSPWDLKTAQMNMQCNLIQELMLYEFKLVYNITKTTKNICFAKGEGTADHSSVTWRIKKFHLSCNTLNNQATSGRPKTMLQAIKANPMTLASHSPVWLTIYITLAKASEAAKLHIMLPKYCKTFYSL